MALNLKTIIALFLALIILSAVSPAYALRLPKPPKLPNPPSLFIKNGAPTGSPDKPFATPKIDTLSSATDNNDSLGLPSIGYGLIMGTVVDIDTQDAIANARVSIPELGVWTTSDDAGQFQFEPIYVGDDEIDTYLTLNILAKGYGKHTMIDVGVFSGVTAIVTLELEKGNNPTKWFGLLRPEERERTKILDLDIFSLNTGATAVYSSQIVPPPYIRIAIRATDPATGKPNPKGAIIRTDTVDFDFYMKHVLPQEWPASWPKESIKAGAMAVKEYAWYWVNKGGKYSQYNADLDNSVNSQVYNPNISYSSSDSAVDNVAANGWYQNGAIFQSFYCAGNYSNPSQKCPVSPSNSMAQNGSRYWADQGKTYQWILNYYYSPTPTYFGIVPQRSKVYASNATPNSINLNFSSPGAVWYQVNKWANNSWNNVVYFGPNTNFTDLNLVPGRSYYYIACAWNSAGWGAWSFNNGHMAAVAKSPLNSLSPITGSPFITNSQIILSAKSSGSNIIYYYVIKLVGGSWKNIYYGSPPVLNPEYSTTSPDKLTPNPYVDARDKSFVYVDKSLSPGTGHYYSVAVYDSKLGWSDFTNYQGYISVLTQK